MEAILELIFTIVLAPFESRYDDVGRGIKNIPNKGVRLAAWIFWILIPLSLFLACAVCAILFFADIGYKQIPDRLILSGILLL